MKPINTPVAIRMEFVGFDDVSGRAPGRAKGTAQDLPGTEQLIREEKMPYTRLTVTVIMSGLLSACAGVGPSPDVIAKSTQFEQTIPACKDSKECEVMWAAARDWVLSNISWKIQTISDGFIQTFSPPLGDITLAATVRKQPQMDGSYRIIVSTHCNNPVWGFCSPDSWEAALHFNRTVNAAVGR